MSAAIWDLLDVLYLGLALLAALISFACFTNGTDTLL